MRKLIVTVGVPGSGKTYWAEQFTKERPGTVIVCKDNIRKVLEETGWKWSPENEKEVIKIRNSNIRGAFARGAEIVICADTNFGRHQSALQGLAKGAGAEFEVKDFTQVPLEVCIERDAKRDKPIGEVVIRGMYEKYVAIAKTDRYVPDFSKPRAFICDLDGTLALFNGKRSPYDTAKCGGDELNVPVANVVKLLVRDGQEVLYVSGREEKFRPQTLAWMNVQALPAGPLYMRATGDHRKDNLVKLELFNNGIRNNYNITLVLDDRNQVVDMWRKLGLTCLQVADGNF